ncbi:hypothetical protein [Pseudomonas sp. PS02290]|uniref:hypothetical protein n=1 Tax=Pseudomonas sp. PS02290 TaxID=2991430 RepID=UPI00249CA15D|nr:hypothetical protein [Pseudomonas sp. PS02290]
MRKQPQLVFKNVTGIEAAKALAEKLLEESAFYQVTPLPAGEYEFAVKLDRQCMFDDGQETESRTYEDADFSTMDMNGLVKWYIKNVGYDPVEDDPSTDVEELRARCTEMLEIDRAGGLDSE